MTTMRFGAHYSDYGALGSVLAVSVYGAEFVPSKYHFGVQGACSSPLATFTGLAKQSYRAGEDIEEGGRKKGRRQKKKEKSEKKKEKRETRHRLCP